jgi:hypothetical protein
LTCLSGGFHAGGDREESRESCRGFANPRHCSGRRPTCLGRRTVYIVSKMSLINLCRPSLRAYINVQYPQWCRTSAMMNVVFASNKQSERTVSEYTKGIRNRDKGLGASTKINRTQCTPDDSDRNPRPLNGQRSAPQRAMT